MRGRKAKEPCDSNLRSRMGAARADRGDQAYIECAKAAAGRKCAAMTLSATALMAIPLVTTVALTHVECDIGVGRPRSDGSGRIGDMVHPGTLTSNVVKMLTAEIRAGRPPSSMRNKPRPRGLRPPTEAQWLTGLVEECARSMRAAAARVLKANGTQRPSQASR